MSRIKNLSIKLKGKTFLIKAEEIKNQIWFHFAGKIFILKKDEVKKPAPGASSKARHKKTDIILSPMPGKIVKVSVQKQSAVKQNQTLFILSSMKMEYTVKAPGKGHVKSVHVREGDMVSADQKLMEIIYT